MNRRQFVGMLAGGAAAGWTVGRAGAWAPLLPHSVHAADDLEALFQSPPPEAGLWAIWHWTNANVTREGITADLEAMAEGGITGAQLFSVGARDRTTFVETPADPLSPYWWDLVQHAIAECDRLGLTLGMQICDGWATAGGPWITPELSMHELVWTVTDVEGGKPVAGTIPLPPSKRDYYRDVSVTAFPIPDGWDETNETRRAVVTTDLPATDPALIGRADNNDEVVFTDRPGSITYTFAEPFTLRSLTTRARQYNRALFSLEVQASDDGKTFRNVGSLEAMGNGWQSNIGTLTHAVPETTARVFRLVYRPGAPIPYREHMNQGSLPGTENHKLRVTSIVLSSTPCIHHLEAKNAGIWGISRPTPDEAAPPGVCIPASSLVDLTPKLKADHMLDWTPAEGRWRILRIGTTTTGHTNAPAGAGQGLECDKFNPEAARIQFEGWFGEALRRAGPAAGRVLHVLNIDSWEAGAQNWSPLFAGEFKRRRGYDLMPFLPVMAGIPINDAVFSEKVLRDVRETVAELVHDHFYVPVVRMAHERGCIVSSESVAPTMPSDGMLHYETVDIPAAEYWHRTVRADKPTDVRDAASAAHVYGKNIVLAEAFTDFDIDWTETPYGLKALGDYQFTQGINKMMLHVWAHQPYPGRQPGVRLMGGIGTFFGAHQTWWKPGRAWLEYVRRCQALLQAGRPVADIACFTGEDVPRRAFLPSEVQPALPDGFAFDSVNRDALVRLARVADGKLVFPGGTSYRLLVLPPSGALSPEVARTIRDLVAAGLTVYGPRPRRSPGKDGDEEVRRIAGEVWGPDGADPAGEHPYGLGRVVWGTPMDRLLESMALAPDLLVFEAGGNGTGVPVPAGGVGWIHRGGPEFDLYFLANSTQESASIIASFRKTDRLPEFWYPDTGRIEAAVRVSVQDGRLLVPLDLDPSGSVLVVFRHPLASADPVVAVSGRERLPGVPYLRLSRTEEGLRAVSPVAGSWTLRTASGKVLPLRFAAVPDVTRIEGPWSLTLAERVFELPALTSWSDHEDPTVRYFSGTAVYRKTFTAPGFPEDVRTILALGDAADLAHVRLNDTDLGVLWKPPFETDVTGILKAGENRLEIEVTNTWLNRLIGDAGLPEDQRVTWLANGGQGIFGGPIKPDAPLLPAGLLGPVRVVPYGIVPVEIS